MTTLPTASVPFEFTQLAVYRPDCGGNQWFTSESDIRALIWLASLTDGPILEMGCNQGITTFNLAIRFPKRCVKGVDWGGEPTMLEIQKAEQSPSADIGKYAKWLPNVIIMDRNLQDCTAADLGACGFVFIDGDHSEPAVRSNTHLAMETGPNIIAWHDYDLPDNNDRPWIGVRTVVHELIPSGYQLFSIPGTMLAYGILR